MKSALSPQSAAAPFGLVSLIQWERLARLVFRIATQHIRSRAALIHYMRRTYSILREAGLKGVLARLRFHASADGTYRSWVASYDTLSPEDLAQMHSLAAEFPQRPLISILVPVYNTNGDILRTAIESVRSQTYDNWELCLADDASTLPHVCEILAEYAHRDPRIKVVCRRVNGHICEASNSALALASGLWVALLDHDDVLSPHALFCVVDAINRHPSAKLIYSDEDKIDLDGERRFPYFKPDWNPELLLSHNMICHLGVYRTDLVRALGGFRAGFEGAQDHDLALRYIEHIEPAEIHHIPHVLYHWRMVPGSTALNSAQKPYARSAGARALAEHLHRRNIRAHVEISDAGYRVRYELPSPAPVVTLIIPTRNRHQLLEQCVSSICKLTTYPNYEILIVDNGSDAPASLAYLARVQERAQIRVLRDERPFNYSALNNAAVAAAKGSIIGLLNNDTEVISPDWLDEMVALACQPGVGAVGARLWYSDDRIQHAGVVLGIGGVAGHVYRHLLRNEIAPCSRARFLQSFSVVTAACLIVRKDLYVRAGGLNENDLAVALNDVDFCLKLREIGCRNVWTPHAELYHHESASRGADDTPAKAARFRKECDYMLRRWGTTLRQDPAYSPNLTLEREDFSPAFPPRAEKPWRVGAIRRIAPPLHLSASNGSQISSSTAHR
jgi:GT2 family glycosyltransferase